MSSLCVNVARIVFHKDQSIEREQTWKQLHNRKTNNRFGKNVVGIFFKFVYSQSNLLEGIYQYRWPSLLETYCVLSCYQT